MYVVKTDIYRHADVLQTSPSASVRMKLVQAFVGLLIVVKYRLGGLVYMCL